MIPIACSVNWYEGYSNDPVLEIIVDEIPKFEDLRFEHVNNLWFAEKDGYVSFFCWAGPKNENGFCGRHYTITTVNGEKVTLKGPWTSRAGVMNDFFTQSLDVHIKTHDKLNCCWCAGHVTLDFALEAIKLCEKNIWLLQKCSHGEYTYVPSRTNNERAE